MKLKDVFFGILILAIGFTGGYFIKSILPSEQNLSESKKIEFGTQRVKDLGEIIEVDPAIEHIKEFQRNYNSPFNGFKSFSFSIDSLKKMMRVLALDGTQPPGQRNAIRVYPAYNSNLSSPLYFVFMGEKWTVDEANPGVILSRNTMLNDKFYNHTDPCPSECPNPEITP